ncbi:MAG: 3-oxoacyl-[acyl-carrier-protein] reductase [bacterium]
MELKDRVSIVTGGGQGIGKAISLGLARNGAKVVIVDISQENADSMANEIETLGGSASAYKMDVSNYQEVCDTVNKILDKYGKIDILVNNAGITRDGLLLKMKEEDWDKVLGINLKGVFNCTKAVLRPMLKERWGRIVNMASIVGLIGNAGQANYSASKAGMIGFTKTVAREVASRNITVNAIAPGFIATEMTKVLPDDVKENLMKQIPLGRLGRVEDVAEIILFLVSEKAGYITGEVIRVDGGMAM